jgi:hypothetical protein
MTAATNWRNRRAQARTRRRAGASGSPRAARQRRAETATFTYSDPMFLTAVDGPSGRLATYVYDSESKRRRIYEGAAFTTLVWDGWDYLQWRRPSGTHVFHTMNGEIVGESVGGVVRDYLLDPLGSVVATLDSGGIVDQFEYWPYGEPVDDLPEGAPVFLWVGGLGYWFDADERRYVRHRMLRTDLGSWMQLDPLWPGSQLAYTYSRSSPVRFVDVSGLQANPPCCEAAYRRCAADSAARCRGGSWVKCSPPVPGSCQKHINKAMCETIRNVMLQIAETCANFCRGNNPYSDPNAQWDMMVCCCNQVVPPGDTPPKRQNLGCAPLCCSTVRFAPCLYDCLYQHEMVHVEHCNIPHLSGVQKECEAYRVQLQCLLSRYTQHCGGTLSTQELAAIQRCLGASR